MNQDLVILFLLGFIAVREIFFLKTVDKLTNKVMSKNYYDYSLSENVDKKVTQPVFKETDYSEAEDMGSISGIV